MEKPRLQRAHQDLGRASLSLTATSPGTALRTPAAGTAVADHRGQRSRRTRRRAANRSAGRARQQPTASRTNDHAADGGAAGLGAPQMRQQLVQTEPPAAQRPMPLRRQPRAIDLHLSGDRGPADRATGAPAPRDCRKEAPPTATGALGISVYAARARGTGSKGGAGTRRTRDRSNSFMRSNR